MVPTPISELLVTAAKDVNNSGAEEPVRENSCVYEGAMLYTILWRSICVEKWSLL